MATEAAAALKKERHEKEASRLKKRAADWALNKAAGLSGKGLTFHI
jgi:hypothetical protein